MCQTLSSTATTAHNSQKTTSVVPPENGRLDLRHNKVIVKVKVY
jgi:hypothetical protein